MARQKSRKQWRAIFARMKQQAKQYAAPAGVALGTGVVVGATAKAGAKRIVPHLLDPLYSNLDKFKDVKSTARVAKVARQLYPKLRKTRIDRHVGDLIGEAGGFFSSPDMNRTVARFSPGYRMQRQRVLADQKSVLALENKVKAFDDIKPTSALRAQRIAEAQRKLKTDIKHARRMRKLLLYPTIGVRHAEPSTVAHELGHAKFATTKVGRYVQRAGSLIEASPTISKKALPVASLGAQPIISNSSLSEKNKRRLRYATAAAGASAVAPQLVDEAVASGIGLRILHKAKVPHITKRTIKILTPGYISYAIDEMPTVATTFGGAAAAGVYAKHQQNKKLQRKKKTVRRI